jgi:hypothetical protein
MCLPSVPDFSSESSSFTSTPDVLIPITTPSISTSSYSSKPPITQTYIHRSCSIPTTGPNTDLVPDSCTNNTESNDVFNQGYHLRDRGTIEPPDRYGFPRASVAIVEPTTYQEASGILEWQLAMIDELAALECTGTWDIVPLPSHVVPITCKWVFKVMTKSDGSIERYKARLVDRGFQQTQGLDYDETFAPVAHMTTVQTLIVVAASSSWTISQMDVKNAFSMVIYMKKFICIPLRGLIPPQGMFVVFVAHCMV